MVKESYEKGKWMRFVLDETVNSNFPIGLNFAGNYSIFVNRKCIYIGQSENIKKRLRTHIQMARYSNTWKTSWGYFLRIEIAVRKEKFKFERVMIESRLIYKIKPLFNQLLKGQKIRKNKKSYQEKLKNFQLNELYLRRINR